MSEEPGNTATASRTSGRDGGRRLFHALAILAFCAAAAAGIAWWWASRGEERMARRLQRMPTPDLERLAAQRTWDPQVLYYYGVRLTNAGRHKEALKPLVLAAALSPRSAAIRAALGVAFARNDRPQDAESQLQQAVALNPRDPFARFALGSLYGRYGRWEKAAEQLRESAALRPDDVESRYLLATCYGEMYLTDRKMEILELLAKEVPHDIRVLRSLGIVYLFFGRFAQAEATYRRILQIAPDDQETRYLLGRALAEQASTPEGFAAAEKELREVALRASQEPTVRVALGILYFRRNEPGRAIPELERAVQLHSTENKTLMYLGQAYMRVGRSLEGRRTLAEFERRGRISRSISQLENRIFSTPGDSPERLRDRNEVRLRLVRVYMEDFQYDRALQHLLILRESDPRNAELARLERQARSGLRASVPENKSRPAGAESRRAGGFTRERSYGT